MLPRRWRCRCDRSHNWVFEAESEDALAQDFGDRTSLVNALRNRQVYQLASLRLLSDLVDVMRGSVTRGGRPVPAADDGEVLGTDGHLIRRAARSSPCLYQSLQLPRRTLGYGEERPEMHKVLLCQETNLNAPLDVLAHLLAAAIAGQFNELAAAVTFDRKPPTAHIWRGPHHVAGVRVESAEAVVDALRQATGKRGGKELDPFPHMVVAAPARPQDLPNGFARPRRSLERGDDERGYDRIVYLTERVPARAPERWVQLLGPAALRRRPEQAGADPSGPYFCSFIPSIVGRARSAEVRPFDTEPVDQEMQTPRRRRVERPGWRLRRDRCRVPFRLGDLARRWDGGGPASRGSIAGALLRDEGIRHVAYRWARAVTNRQVGIALSGGGAASYGLVPLIRGLEEGGVPIDVVSGVSGGALVGAYYCHAGLQGLARCIERGGDLQQRIRNAVYDSDSIRQLVDRDLRGVDVDDTDVRFVAVTTALPDQGRPAARTVTAGPLAEAVQVSGAAPLLFAPVEKSTPHGSMRFADGATASFIPARILKDWGADLVFAFNCLAGPKQRNPLDDNLLGRLAYERTVVGRLIDLWISGGYLVEQISRETDEDAHVYFEPAEEAAPLVSSFEFARAAQIAKASAASPRVKDAIQDCVEAWCELSRRKTR